MIPQWHDLIFLALPGVISIIVQPDWPGAKKFLTAIVVCFVAAMIELVLAGTCTLGNLPELFGKALVLCMASYATIWKAWGASDKIESGVNSGSTLPAEVTAVLEAETAAAKKEAEVVQAQVEAGKAQEVVVEAKEKENGKPSVS
jgi:hypothetical protein